MFQVQRSPRQAHRTLSIVLATVFASSLLAIVGVGISSAAEACPTSEQVTVPRGDTYCKGYGTVRLGMMGGRLGATLITEPTIKNAKSITGNIRDAGRNYFACATQNTEGRWLFTKGDEAVGGGNMWGWINASFVTESKKTTDCVTGKLAKPTSLKVKPVALATPAGGKRIWTDDKWDLIAQCESGGNWAINTGNGYSGGLQFSPTTWRAFGGGTSPAYKASRAQQIAVAERVLAKQGSNAWPSCSRKAGLRYTP